MSPLALPRLRDTVVLRPFDGAASPRYVVAVDDAHFVVTPVVAAVLEEIRQGPTDGSQDSFEALAQRTSMLAGISITAERIEELLSQRLPRALFTSGPESPAPVAPLLFRRLLWNARTLAPWLDRASPLFEKPVAWILCSLFLSVDFLVGVEVCHHGAGPFNSLQITLGLALTLAGILLHEIGHLAACRRFGAPHGGIGIGLYWCWPAFYAEVHAAWLLPRLQRAAVDAGGIYFQCIFTACLGALYLAHPSPALLCAWLSTHLLMLHTLNPVLKFDGYWLICDLASVHNLHARIHHIAHAALGIFKQHKFKYLPTQADWILFAAFAFTALAYFAYLFTVLGRGLGSAFAQLELTLHTADGAWPPLRALLADAALLGLATILAGSIAFWLAHSLSAVFRTGGDEA